MRIAIAQVRGQIDDPPANASKAKMLLNNTDVDLLIFPEMFSTGYDKNCGQFVKNLDAVFMNKMNKHVLDKKCSMLFGSPVGEDGKMYNAAILTDGENRQTYRKIHLDMNEKFSEREIFTAGNEPMIFNCRGLRIGIAIGNDMMFNELFRWYALNDADIVVCISAVSKPVLERYERIMPARCVDNSIEMIFVNMVGQDSGFVMAGGSKYISYEGKVLESCTDSSDVRIIKLDTERIKASKGKRAHLKEVRNDIKWN
jgi:predicted amidohydrolase